MGTVAGTPRDMREVGAAGRWSAVCSLGGAGWLLRQLELADDWQDPGGRTRERRKDLRAAGTNNTEVGGCTFRPMVVWCHA